MSPINFKRTYLLKNEFEIIKDRADQKLGKYYVYPELFSFDDLEKSVTFSSEKLIPTVSTNRPRVMLLCSNPHPYSVHQGMFLSPNTRGQESLFWPAMRDAGWISTAENISSPNQLAEICMRAEYQGPFDLIFYCYYAFPTDMPDDIGKIFGKEYFKQVIEPEAGEEFAKTIQHTSPKAVITFNKTVFNLVAENKVDRYIDRLMDGELIQSQVKGIDLSIPIFLTLPTGWRYHKQHQGFRRKSLESIKAAIYAGKAEVQLKNIDSTQ